MHVSVTLIKQAWLMPNPFKQAWKPVGKLTGRLLVQRVTPAMPQHFGTLKLSRHLQQA
jgi:hypothetical protein